MRTALDIPAVKLGDHERGFVRDIAEHGWVNTRIVEEPDAPGFSFSTGFWLKHGYPEVILFSLPSDVSRDVLWDVFRDIEEGRPPAVGVPISDIFGNAEAVLLPVWKGHYAEHLGRARWFYRGDDFPCLQLVWPDPAGMFPWQPGFDDSCRGSQPDLTEKGWLSELAH